MKLHELAKEFNLKGPDFIKELNDKGFDYHSFAQSVDELEANKIRLTLAGKSDELKEREKIRELSLVTLIGVYYDIDAHKYQITSLRVYPDEFDKYGIMVSKQYPTVDHLAQDLNKMTVDAGHHSPHELEKVRRKRLTESKK